MTTRSKDAWMFLGEDEEVSNPYIVGKVCQTLTEDDFVVHKIRLHVPLASGVGDQGDRRSDLPEPWHKCLTDFTCAYGSLEDDPDELLLTILIMPVVIIVHPSSRTFS
jgi:hypothetical protein